VGSTGQTKTGGLNIATVSGSVGIGTTTPASPLTVVGAIRSTIGGFIFPDSTTQATAATAGVNYWTLSGTNLFPTSTSYNVGIGTTTPAYTLDVIGTLRTTATTTFSGNVGIETTDPGCTLEVAGDMAITGQSRVRVFGAATLTIPNGVATKVKFDHVTYDEQGEYDPTTNYRFTAKKAGYYLVLAQAEWDTGDVPWTIAMIYKNGDVVSRHQDISGGYTMTPVSDILYLASGDYVEFLIQHGYSSSRNLRGYSWGTFMSIHKLS